MTFITDSTTAIVIDILFIIIFSAYLYWLWGLLRALNSDAPYVPMSRAVIERIVEMAQAKEGDFWIDLGSGDGRVLIAAAKYARIKGVGIERVAPLRLWSRLRILRAGVKDITIRSGDFFKEDLSAYDVVTCYLLPTTMDRLVQKLEKELKPGALVLSHRFPLTGSILESEDTEHKIYAARAPLRRSEIIRD